jgi:DNA polymerase/3'-5' exonuclease PolX
MNKKDLILNKLYSLKELYKNKEDKIWNLRAIDKSITSIKNYKGEIISGTQLENEIKGIGKKISKRIDEILETGDLIELNKSDNNNNLNNILDITGVGLVRAKKWLDLGINNIDDVMNAIKEKKINSTHHIDIGIKYYHELKKKIPREEINNIKILISNTLKKINKDLIFEICGSYRRGILESGDIDILITHPKYIKDISKKNFLKIIVDNLKENKFIIDSLTDKGNTKYMGICKIDSIPRRIDIRVVDYQSYYASLLYFTGNKNFNIYIRNEALKYNYSLNEYGMIDIRDNSIFFVKSEEEIFKILNIEYLKPEDRNNF